MALNNEQVTAIERATQRARRLLEADFQGQLDATYDLPASDVLATRDGAHLDARGRLVRDKLLAALAHKQAGRSLARGPAVLALVRDLAFTTLNRFVALKMLEARGLVQPCVSRGEASSGYQEFCTFAPGLALLPSGAGYRLYLESLFDELSTEIKVLFDRRDPSALLWPGRAAFEALLTELGEPRLEGVWADDETIGWVYQYFNSQDERRALRDASQAPRNSRELAIRNQFFTPRYVVQFLVDNTLGRIWIEMCGGHSALLTEGLCEYLVRPRTELVLRAGALDEHAPRWLRAVASGDFSAVPTDLSFVDSQALAQLIDGYVHAQWMGLGELGDFANPRVEEARRTGTWTGTATELWLTLFFLHRSYRFQGANPDDPETLAFLDALVAALRTALLSGRPDDRLTWMPTRPAKDPRELKVIDPACGSGHFLLYAYDLLARIYLESWRKEGPLSRDYPDEQALTLALPGLILSRNLHGVDIDPRCAQIAQLALWMRAQRAYHEAKIPKARRPAIRRSNIVIAEPMPTDPALLAELSAALDPPLLADLFQDLVGATRLAGDLGLLLRLERAIAGTLEAAKKRYDAITAQRRVKTQFLPGFEAPGEQLDLDFGLLADLPAFLDHAEAKLRDALALFARAASGQAGMRRRLFADDALQGLGLLELCEHRYDVVLMNPPFGAGSTAAKREFELAYPKTKNDVYAAFVERGIELLHPKGRLGAITSRTGFFLSSFQRWREEILLAKAPPVVFADLGAGVLDAMVETAAYCLEVS